MFISFARMLHVLDGDLVVVEMLSKLLKPFTLTKRKWIGLVILYKLHMLNTLHLLVCFKYEQLFYIGVAIFCIVFVYLFIKYWYFMTRILDKCCKCILFVTRARSFQSTRWYCLLTAWECQVKKWTDIFPNSKDIAQLQYYHTVSQISLKYRIVGSWAIPAPT